ncbi:MAG: response regulator [Alphaproteobacteria bacterium]|nr:response regulator [Alphaproteobacteria bacterium]
MPHTVLVVDDSRVARTLTRKLVAEIWSDAVVTEAENGEQALATATAGSFDVILMDMNMPGRDGLTVSGEIQKLKPGQRIILVTANVQDAVRERATALGIAFLGKPPQKADLAALMGP